MGDQVLRLDFVKERRYWEEEMARRAASQISEVEEEDEDVMDAEAEMSPTEEYDPMIDFEEPPDTAPTEDEFVIDDADDEEYERLFREMEILSQSQSQSQKQHETQIEPHSNHSTLTTQRQPNSEDLSQSYDREMDIS
jgi:hypothetical protein